MRSIVLVLTVVFVISFAASQTLAAPPPEAIDAYVRAYTQMGKNAAVMFAQENTRANARSNMFKTLVDAQCKILEAKAQWITAVATANSTNAKTLVTLQEVHSKALDNNLKAAKTFYDKRKQHEEYSQAQADDKKRPTHEAIARYNRASLPKRPTEFQLCTLRGEINWPGALLDESFSNQRIMLSSLFAQRHSASLDSAEDISHEIQQHIKKMLEQLRSRVRDMSPAEYVAARKFLDSLAYEATLPPRIGGLATN